MLEKVSFKGVVLGAIADVGGSSIWVVIPAIYLFSKYHIYLLPHLQQASRLQNLLLHDPVITVLSWLIGGGFSILGGYIAARIAKHDELLNGTLASFLCVLFSLFAIGKSPVLLVIIGVLVNPLLGFVGGYLRLLQK